MSTEISVKFVQGENIIGDENLKEYDNGALIIDTHNGVFLGNSTNKPILVAEANNKNIPNNQIWYTTNDDNIINPYNTDVFGVTIISNEYKNGRGVISFDDSITSIGNSAFRNCTSLTGITIPDSVTSIGYGAFYKCTSLKSITIGNSVTSIGERAFYNCTSLTSVTIGNGVTSIGEYAFYGCTSLTSVSIPDSVTSIGNSAFDGCTSLTSVTIGNGVTSIGNSAFDGCTSLTSVTIGNSVTSIGDEAFSSCSSLTSVTIPDSVTSIGDLAFAGCNGLTSVTIPDSVTSIGERAFYYCTSLISAYCKSTTPPTIQYNSFTNIETIYVPSESVDAYKNATNWSQYGDKITYEYILKTTNIISAPFAIGENVITDNINETIFGKNNKLEQDNIFSVGGGIDSKMRRNSIEVKTDGTVFINDTVFNAKPSSNQIFYKSYSKLSFKDNGDINNNTLISNIWDPLTGKGFLTYANDVTIIPSEYFSINNNTIEEDDYSSDYIGYDELEYNLIELILPKGVRIIEKDILYGQRMLEKLYIPDTVEVYNTVNSENNSTYEINVYFENYKSFNNYLEYHEILFNLYTTIDKVNYFVNDKLIEEVIVPKIKYPDRIYKTSYMIRNKNIKSVIIPDDWDTIIPAGLFSDVKHIKYITIPSKINTFKNNAFVNSNIIQVNTTHTYETWIRINFGNDYSNPLRNGATLYCNDKELRAASISSSEVSDVNNYAFRGCESLMNITNNGIVNTIGDEAFYNCRLLQSFTFYNDDCTIGEKAFFGCRSLTFFKIPECVTSIKNSTFKYCESLSNITIPNSVITIDDSAFGYCIALSDITIPDNVTTIGSGVFSGCKSLRGFYGKFTTVDNRCLIVDNVLKGFAPNAIEEYTIPDNVNLIDNYAFAYSGALRKIIIPDSVTEIGTNAFAVCSNLAEIYCNAIIPPKIASNTIRLNNPNLKIYVPSESVNAYKTATNWSKFADNIIGINTI